MAPFVSVISLCFQSVAAGVEIKVSENLEL